MTRPHPAIRIVLLILIVSMSFIGISYKVFADEAELKSGVTPAAGLIPAPISNLGNPAEAAQFESRSTLQPQSTRQDDSEVETIPEVPPTRRQPHRSMLIPTYWSNGAKLIPTEIDADVQQIRSANHEFTGTETTELRRKSISSPSRVPQTIRRPVMSREKRTVKPGRAEADVLSEKPTLNTTLPVVKTPAKTTQQARGIGKQTPSGVSRNQTSNVLNGVIGLGLQAPMEVGPRTANSNPSEQSTTTLIPSLTDLLLVTPKTGPSSPVRSNIRQAKPAISAKDVSNSTTPSKSPPTLMQPPASEPKKISKPSNDSDDT